MNVSPYISIGKQNANYAIGIFVIRFQKIFCVW